MKWLCYCGIFVLSLLSSESFVVCDDTISLPQGRLRGTHNFILGYRSYLGIPYASIKERYQEPGEAPTWTGTFIANSETACKQYSQLTKSVRGTENCLNANVFTPANKGPEPLPVIVFVHGGGFFWGSNNNLLYNPKFLVEKNVIVVTINYRLGPFGFLCLRTKEAPGNVGLKDQIAALKWIKNNIAYFGGDPDTVTLFGESSGGTSVTYLILSPIARGLFRRAIIHSCTSNSPHLFDKTPLESAAKVARRLGYKTTDKKELLQIFKNSTADKIVTASYVDSTNDALAPYTIMPCVEDPELSENAVLSKEPREMQQFAKEISNMSIIMGYNDKEGIMWASEYNLKGLQKLDNDFTPAIPRAFTFNSEEDRVSFNEAIRCFYSNNSDIEYGQLTNYYTDALAMYPSVLSMEAFLTNPNITLYNYYFKYDSLRNLNKLRTRLRFMPGANHADELFYLFNPIIYEFLPSLPSDLHFVDIMTTLWTNFAKTGKPSTKLVSWLPSEGTLRFLKLDKTIEMIDLPNPERIQFWRTAQEKYGLEYP